MMKKEIVKDYELNGLNALIIRISPQGSPPGIFPASWLCGYIQVPEDSDYYLADNEKLGEIDCHSGITFSGAIKGKDGFYIGFDCAHLMDFSEPKDEAYVEAEINSIKHQL